MAGMWIEIAGHRLRVELPQDAPGVVDGIPFAVDLRELERGILSLLWTYADGRTRSFRCSADADAVVIDGQRIEYSVYDPRSLRGAGAAGAETGPKPLKAPMPGRIVRVLVAPGDTVAAGHGCVVVEAMKMQNELKAPRAGKIARLAAAVGDTVAAGAVLLVVE
jgi:biotin carboxyl carrier protein